MSKGASSVVNALIALRQAKEHFEDAIRENPGTTGQRLIRPYIQKIEWIYTDILTCPYFPEEIRMGIRSEWNSDSFTIPAITEKIAQLTPEQRSMVEYVIDAIISGEELQIEITNDNGTK